MIIKILNLGIKKILNFNRELLRFINCELKSRDLSHDDLKF